MRRTTDFEAKELVFDGGPSEEGNAAECVSEAIKAFASKAAEILSLTVGVDLMEKLGLPGTARLDSAPPHTLLFAATAILNPSVPDMPWQFVFA